MISVNDCSGGGWSYLCSYQYLPNVLSVSFNVIMLETPTLTTNATTLKSLDKFANYTGQDNNTDKTR